ncbi:beta-N-acetylhexosaminidase [Microbacterium sp. P04]|uniref:beta-N-acetylhexosaminidase n=1 Tax=Microbacterium sp. P04 TaxID=3366947 RepID=UPI003745752F
MPAVVHVEPEAAGFRLGTGTSVTGETSAVAEFTALLTARTGSTASVPAEGNGEVRLNVAGSGPAESYRLTVDADGVEVEGADAAGLFYGVQTLAQLLTREDGGWTIPAVRIEDAPRFAYRGVMLDVARHFFSLDVVEAYIERAAALKLNHLHLHLTDDQGWRLQLASRPELTERASAGAVGGDAGGFYSVDDYARIIAAAAARHMTVVPEIDVPGHTHAVGLAYPEIAADPVIDDAVRATAEQFGGGLPTAGEAYTGMAVGFSSLRIGEAATDRFLSDVFGELAARTPGPYLHLGGDEAHGTAPEHYAAFVRRAVEIIAATGKTPMAWHEAGGASPLPSPIVGHYWGFRRAEAEQADAAAAIVAEGGALVLSPADAAYLDMKPDADAALGLTWANGPTSVERSYEWEPTAVLPGVPESALLGVEAPLWTETVRTLADIDALIFPRVASAAEIAWSPRPTPGSERTWASFRARVGELGALWRAQGIDVPSSNEIAGADA